MKLSYKKCLWLHTRGGRNAYDVIHLNDRGFVEMGNGKGGEILVEIPEDQMIGICINNKGYILSCKSIT